MVNNLTMPRHLRIFKHRIPAHFLLLTPLAYMCAVGRPDCVRDLVGKVASPLAERKDPPVLALTCSVSQGVQLRAQSLAHRSCARHTCLRQLVDGLLGGVSIYARFSCFPVAICHQISGMARPSCSATASTALAAAWR